MSEILQLFEQPALNVDLLEKIGGVEYPRRRYIIAITPRSGSSYLCNALKNTKRLGWPQEVLEQNSVAIRLAKNMPGRTPEEYICNTLKVTKTANNVAGLKTSWFQFENFMAAMTDHGYLSGFKYVYLTRRDLSAQAVSLYKAVATNVFHSVQKQSEESLAKLATLEYDYAAIRYWYDHIIVQERGWQQYFFDHRIFPLHITYEDIEEDIVRVIKRISHYVGVKPESLHFPEQISNFQKIRNEQSTEWARRFANTPSLNAPQ